MDLHGKRMSAVSDYTLKSAVNLLKAGHTTGEVAASLIGAVYGVIEYRQPSQGDLQDLLTLLGHVTKAIESKVTK